jgi:HSP20 family molecular chaperone IbpA
VKVQQNDEAWTVTLDVPGISREQLTIDVDGAVVRVQTVQDAPRQYKAAYELPADIDAEATFAKLENGVLTLALGKKKPVVTARQIEVK